ncbi:Uncharacterised protein [Amycolatopsis camponoti]|uniref:Uncharacterized protein n=1 Tax=Amycolatopsis camponoti TaxID=2606593 RepID=A0A6I8LKX2_9PSEU|nr:Uncharacterised protein [Amycolatopsis camponoti]
MSGASDGCTSLGGARRDLLGVDHQADHDGGEVVDNRDNVGSSREEHDRG